jgi:hypothetical protein
VKPPDETAVTFPEAMLRLAKRLAPGGVEPLVGNVPWVDLPLPLNRRPLKPPNPVLLPAQFPLEFGWVIMTVVAVTGPFEPLDPPVPDAVTHSPTVTAEDETLTVWVNDVVGVQLTVTWPLSGFWTSIEVPLIAATLPLAPGGVGRDEGADWDELAALAELGDEELQAAHSAPSAPSAPIRTTAPRRG